MSILLLLFFGAFSGIIGAMGMGGGTLLIPLLTIFLNVPQALAQGLNLLAFLPMSIIAIIVHFKNNMLVLDNIFWIIGFGIVFSVAGSMLANSIDQNILKVGFGGFLIVLGILTFVSAFKKK